MRHKQPEFRTISAGCRSAFVYASGFSLFINLLQLTVPLYMMQLIDRVLMSRSYETLGLLSLIAVFALITMTGLEIVRSQVMGRAGAWFERRFSFDTFGHAIKRALARKAYTTEAPGDLATVRGFLSSNSLNALFDAPWVPIYLLLLFLLHPLMGWVGLAGATVLLVLTLASEYATRKPTQAATQMGQRSFTRLLSAMRNAEVVDAMGMAPSLAARWFNVQNESIALHEKAAARSAKIYAVSKFTRLLVQLSILGVGTVLVMNSEITAGVMIAGSIILARALSPVEQAIGSWKNMVSARASFHRLKALFAEAAHAAPRMRLPNPAGHLSVEQVTHFFQGAEEPVIRGVSFTCEPGDALAIIGPSASGKSTLARIIIGASAPGKGAVRLDGADITSWDRSGLGQHVGYLPQDVELFAGTVKENIGRMADAKPEAVVQAAKDAGVHEVILRLPQGYDTDIGDGGANLSGGQRQLVGIARALFGRPRLIVLDEPNASLDGDGERALVEAIMTMRRDGATVVVVSHRPSILRAVNKVLVLRAGAVEMFGPTQRVMSHLTESSEDGGAADVTAQETERESPSGLTSERPVMIQGGRP